MKKYFFAVIVFFIYIQACAQLIKKGNDCVGFGKFILGSPIANFTAFPVDGGKYAKDGRLFQIYTGEGNYELLGTTFSSILMTFNDSNTLVNFSFIKFYKKADSPRFAKEAKKYYEQLTAYIKGELNSEGKKKTYYHSAKSALKGYEWESTTALLKVSLNSTQFHSTVQVSFEKHD